MGRVRTAVLIAVAAVLLVPAAAAAAPTGYVAFDGGEDEIWVGTVDLGAGSPTTTNIGSTGLPATASMNGLALAPSGVLIGLETVGDVLYAIDPATGAVVDSLPIDHDFSNAQPVVLADGRVFYADSTSLREVDLATGTTTVRATFPQGVGGAAARCVDAAGTHEIFAVAPGVAQVYRLDTATFTVTTLPQPLGIPGINSPKLGFDTGGTLWALNLNLVNPSTFTIDTTTGAATTVGASQATSSAGLAITAPSCPPPTPDPVVVTPAFTG